MDISTFGVARILANAIPGSAAKRAEDAAAAAESAAELLQPPATSSDVGKALIAKTVEDGKVTEYEYGEAGGGTVTDVQVNNVSVLDAQGVANIPKTSSSVFGVAKTSSSYGITAAGGILRTAPSTSDQVKEGTDGYKPIAPDQQHKAAFFGLAKAAGSDEKDSALPLGQYTDSAKAAIQHMLGTDAAIADYEADTTADQAYAVGELFMLNGKLHQATAAIAVGDTLTVGTNCSVVNIADVFPHDVQVNGVSVLQDGVANVPVASKNTLGVVKIVAEYGIMDNSAYDCLMINPATAGAIKDGKDAYRPITPSLQNVAAFYGLARAAGADMKKVSGAIVGIYPAAQKSAISQMLNAPETVTGTTPNITALAGVRYICGEVSTVTITPPSSGVVDVRFASGSTPAVMTVVPPTGMTISWPEWFDPDNLDADTVYEVSIEDGVYAAVMSWT